MYINSSHHISPLIKTTLSSVSWHCGHIVHQQVDWSSNLGSLADLPSHVAAAGELAKRLQLPHYYPLSNSSLETVDPLKDAAGGVPRAGVVSTMLPDCLRE